MKRPVGVEDDCCAEQYPYERAITGMHHVTDMVMHVAGCLAPFQYCVTTTMTCDHRASARHMMHVLHPCPIHDVMQSKPPLLGYDSSAPLTIRHNSI